MRSAPRVTNSMLCYQPKLHHYSGIRSHVHECRKKSFFLLSCYSLGPDRRLFLPETFIKMHAATVRLLIVHIQQWPHPALSTRVTAVDTADCRSTAGHNYMHIYGYGTPTKGIVIYSAGESLVSPYSRSAMASHQALITSIFCMPALPIADYEWHVYQAHVSSLHCSLVAPTTRCHCSPLLAENEPKPV